MNRYAGFDWEQDSDYVVDMLIQEYDKTVMPLPDIEFEPHLLISKVRKHYMEYLIKLLSINYENNQKLLNKNIYLPSAIWRCAKNIEMSAAQACMVIQLYRKNIVNVIKGLKNDTKKGKLNKQLYEFLRKPPANEKKMQTSLTSNNVCQCQCTCNKRKKTRSSTLDSPKAFQNCNINSNNYDITNKSLLSNTHEVIYSVDDPKTSQHCKQGTLTEQLPNTELIADKQLTNVASTTNDNIPVETQEADELMLQLEKLFQCDSNDDDLFDGALCNNINSTLNDESAKPINDDTLVQGVMQKRDPLVDSHAAKIKSLDERLESLTGLLVANNNSDSNNIISKEKTSNVKNKKINCSKWLCEEYFLKVRLLELMEQIGDSNRKKLARVKVLLAELFGEDSDDEDILSPLEETPEFVISCKERIAPWVVKLLTPYYIKGRIIGKALFKALAKHLIRLIYQCSQYPHEYEVYSFVADFLENHKMIRCEADFKQFRIENI